MQHDFRIDDEVGRALRGGRSAANVVVDIIQRAQSAVAAGMAPVIDTVVRKSHWTVMSPQRGTRLNMWANRLWCHVLRLPPRMVANACFCWLFPSEAMQIGRASCRERA